MDLTCTLQTYITLMIIQSMKFCLVASRQSTNDLAWPDSPAMQLKSTEKVQVLQNNCGLGSNFDVLTFHHVVVSWLLVKSSDGYKIRIKLKRKGKEKNVLKYFYLISPFHSLSHLWFELCLQSTHHNTKECWVSKSKWEWLPTKNLSPFHGSINFVAGIMYKYRAIFSIAKGNKAGTKQWTYHAFVEVLFNQAKCMRWFFILQ